MGSDVIVLPVQRRRNMRLLWLTKVAKCLKGKKIRKVGMNFGRSIRRIKRLHGRGVTGD